MTLDRTMLLVLCLGGATAALAADEPPAQLDPVEVSAAKRTENAFREVQLGMERTRSEKAEDAEKIVCLKQKPTGSNIPVINCATNYFWDRIRANSLSQGVGTVMGVTGGGGGGTGKKDEKVFTMSLTDYDKFEKRYGQLPKELHDKL